MLIERIKLLKSYPHLSYSIYLENWRANPTDKPTPMEACYSTIDGSYIGDKQEAKTLCRKLGIKPQALPNGNVACIGFNDKEQKWYGWSHRAIFGFGIGHKITKDSMGFIASNEDEFIQHRVAFFTDEHREPIQTKVENGILKMSAKYKDTVPDASLIGTTWEYDRPLPTSYGKGEWTAKTLEDCKQMAIDFTIGVS